MAVKLHRRFCFCWQTFRKYPKITISKKKSQKVKIPHGEAVPIPVAGLLDPVLQHRLRQRGGAKSYRVHFHQMRSSFSLVKFWNFDHFFLFLCWISSFMCVFCIENSYFNNVFMELDEDGSCQISRGEFDRAFKRPDMQREFSKLGFQVNLFILKFIFRFQIVLHTFRSIVNWLFLKMQLYFT